MVPQILLAAAVVVVELDLAAEVPGLPELGGRRNEEDQVRDLEQGHWDVEQHQTGNLGLEEAPPIEGHRTVLLHRGLSSLSPSGSQYSEGPGATIAT